MNVPSSAFGPRASITKIGACDQMPDGQWRLTGWAFDGRMVGAGVESPGCVGLHDDHGRHIGVLGWTYEELRALSEAEFELSGLPTTDRSS